MGAYEIMTQSKLKKTKKTHFSPNDGKLTVYSALKIRYARIKFVDLD